jgi:hypothetical protein
MPDKVPVTVRLLKSPRCPIRNTRSAKRAQAVAQGHVGTFENFTPQCVGGVPLGKPHGGERRRIFRLVAALDLETPMSHRASRRLCRAGVTGEDLIQSFGVQHLQCNLQALQQIG